MVGIRIILMVCLLLSGVGICSAQGRFSGGQGGGDASLALRMPGATGKIYTYPNPARVGEPIRVYGADSKEIYISNALGGILTKNSLAFDRPGIYMLKLNNQWLKQLVY